MVSWLRGKKLEMPLDIIQQQVRHVTAEAFLNDDAQRRQVFSILGKGVGGNQPAAVAEPFGEIENGKIRDLFEGESKNGDIAPVTDEIKRPHLRYRAGEIERRFLAGFVDARVAFFAQA